jgi:hypothetical protein
LSASETEKRTLLPLTGRAPAELSASEWAFPSRVELVSERFSNDAVAAWQELDRADYDRYWAGFNTTFEFRAGVKPDS